MRANKLADAIATVILVLFALWVVNLVLGFGLGVMGLVLGLIGGLLSLIFSKNFIVLSAIGLVVYLVFRNNDRPQPRDDYYRY